MADPYKDRLHQLSPTQFPERDRRGKIKRVPRQPRPQSYFQDIRMARLGPRKGAPEKLGISYEDYQNKLHPELGGEDWGANEPEGGFTIPTWDRLVADTIVRQQAIDKQKKSPLTQQEKDMKEYKDSLVEIEKRRWRDEYNAQQRALGGNAMMSNVGLSGAPITAEDVLQGGLTAAQLSPYWKGASAVKFGYDIATGKTPSWWDAGLAAVGYGSKTKIGKGAVDTLKSLWGKTPKKAIAAKATAAGTIPFFASEAKEGAYPKEGFRPEPVEPQPIDHGRGGRAKIDRVRRQTMLR